MDFREVGYDDKDWINLAQDRDRWRAYKYEVEFLLQQQWFDPRLKYSNKSEYEFLNAIHHHNDIWLPDTYFIMHGDFKDPLIPVHFALRIYRNGTVSYLMRRHLILSCQGHLHIFPFDDPQCSFAMESIDYDESDPDDESSEDCKCSLCQRRFEQQVLALVATPTNAKRQTVCAVIITDVILPHLTFLSCKREPVPGEEEHNCGNRNHSTTNCRKRKTKTRNLSEVKGHILQDIAEDLAFTVN
ncbi:hypothetical protein ANN_25946 [Periplaneta americana]|uniref:Neurotransmitter-gated ion-channel ligand-binding domain-containing protein n=1 Tax=Periplaneta americana TaxID=6978 RepID=A0ABQ8S4X5_PERAM|nr:hypothetical protein ANN_25946 [Periplaneta americana]